MSNMRLNNAVEEALGQGDDWDSGSGSSLSGCSHRPSAAHAAIAASTGEATRLSALRINHAEDEQYGMRHHES